MSLPHLMGGVDGDWKSQGALVFTWNITLKIFCYHTCPSNFILPPVQLNKGAVIVRATGNDFNSIRLRNEMIYSKSKNVYAHQCLFYLFLLTTTYLKLGKGPLLASKTSDML